MVTRILMIMLLTVSVAACSSSKKDLGDSDGAILGQGEVYGGVDGSAQGTEIYDGSSVGMVDSSTIPGSVQDFIANAGDTVFFETDSHSVTGAARSTLDAQARWLNTYSSLGIVVEGHADERGTREYNLALGDRRANSARNYLISMGVSPSRITTISYGKEQPLIVGNGQQYWSQNRRAVTRVQ